MPQDLSSLSLAIVCPMANEGRLALKFVDEVLEHCRGFRRVKFLAILDRATRDESRELLEEHAVTAPELTVIWAPENRGIVDAYLRGYREALALDSDWILEIDAGFSHQPSDVPLLLEKMAQGYDCVFGSRFCEGGSMKDSPAERYWISWGGTFLANLLLGAKLTDMTSGFQLFTRASLRALVDRGIVSRGPFFQTEMKAYCHQLRTAEVPIQYRAASHSVGGSALGDAAGNLWRLFRLRLTGQL